MPHSLRHHNTFGIDATCTQLVEYTSLTQLHSLLPQLHQQRWLHIGAGSNLLFVQPHFEGIVLQSHIQDIEQVEQNAQSLTLRVAAGKDWDQFVAYCVEKGYHGLENLSHIPGQVGASAVQNVGAYGVEAADRIQTVETIEVSTGKTCLFQAEQCQYGYRTSIFKHELRGQHIITHVSFRLERTFQPILTHVALVQHLEAKGIAPQQATAQQVRQAIIDVRSSKLPDPKEIGSAGSFFMNPVISNEQAQTLLKQYPSMPHYPTSTGVKVPAAWLIEQCGWKGKCLGQAAVHDRQALVLVNPGQATGQDIATLAATIQQDVREQFDITISPEVLYIQ